MKVSPDSMRLSINNDLLSGFNRAFKTADMMLSANLQQTSDSSLSVSSEQLLRFSVILSSVRSAQAGVRWILSATQSPVKLRWITIFVISYSCVMLAKIKMNNAKSHIMLGSSNAQPIFIYLLPRVEMLSFF